MFSSLNRSPASASLVSLEKPVVAGESDSSAEIGSVQAVQSRAAVSSSSMRRPLPTLPTIKEDAELIIETCVDPDIEKNKVQAFAQERAAVKKKFSLREATRKDCIEALQEEYRQNRTVELKLASPHSLEPLQSGNAYDPNSLDFKGLLKLLRLVKFLEIKSLCLDVSQALFITQQDRRNLKSLTLILRNLNLNSLKTEVGKSGIDETLFQGLTANATKSAAITATKISDTTPHALNSQQ